MIRLKPLDANRINEAIALLHQCNHHDGLRLSLLVTGDPNTEIGAFLDDQLVGFASLPDDPDLEGWLVVSPDHRRRGIGRALLTELALKARSRGWSTFALSNDEASAAGRAFVRAAGGTPEATEHQLLLEGPVTHREPLQLPGLVIRSAVQADRDALIAIRAAAFQDDEDAVAGSIERGMAERDRHYLIAEIDAVPVAMVRIGEWDGRGDITSLAVCPDFQGRGIGRALLLHSVDQLHSAGWSVIALEVATDNPRALELYTGAGFRIVSTFRAYRFSATAAGSKSA